MNVVEIVLRVVLVGLAGAALMDVWGFVLRRGFGVPTLDYALLGRWIGHMPRGRFAHARIAAADPVRGERALGWVAHYGIGVAFAVPLVAAWGVAWFQSPSVVPAIAVGLGTIAAPWLVMQPALGMGVAASRSPDPRGTRLRNLGTHAVYGLGLFLAASVLTWVRGGG